MSENVSGTTLPYDPRKGNIPEAPAPPSSPRERRVNFKPYKTVTYFNLNELPGSNFISSGVDEHRSVTNRHTLPPGYEIPRYNPNTAVSNTAFQNKPDTESNAVPQNKSTPFSNADIQEFIDYINSFKIKSDKEFKDFINSLSIQYNKEVKEAEKIPDTIVSAKVIEDISVRYGFLARLAEAMFYKKGGGRKTRHRRRSKRKSSRKTKRHHARRT